MDGTSHFLIPGGLEFNLSRAPSEAKHTRVWVHPKRLKLEHRPRTERRLLLAWRERRAKGTMGAHQGGEEAASKEEEGEYLGRIFYITPH